MKFSQTLNDAFNQQIAHEYRNKLIYKRIQNYFEQLQLTNLSSKFEKQAQEENGHANKFLDHINDRTGGVPEILLVDSLPFEIRKIEDVANVYIKVEEETTKSIESLYDLANSERSYIDLPFISEMLNEQVGEEKESQEFAAKILMVKDLVLFDATFK